LASEEPPVNSHRSRRVAFVTFVTFLALMGRSPSANAAEDDSRIVTAAASATCELLVHNGGYFADTCWFITCESDDPIDLGCGLTQMHEVTDLTPTSDHRWLAVISVGEGHPILEVVDLELLLASHRYHVVAEFNPYPGSIGIIRWTKGALLVNSDIMLPEISTWADGREDLLLDSPGTFSITIGTWQVRELRAPSTVRDPTPDPSLQRTPPG
jgi:hypothetical protein